METSNRIIPMNYVDTMKKAYIDYAMSVILQRALPDIRDGLKPVQRRVLYSMKELGLVPTYDIKKKKYILKQQRKSARIVGDTMGKYHPHGDSSIYEALVLMAQKFKMMEPLIKGGGNFGSIDGDGAAAMRYTEATLPEVINSFLSDLDKDVVDFRDNFDGTLQEPIVLPAKFPNLLVNGSSGIAVGMSTKIPSHNLYEVINGVLAYLKNPNITIDEIVEYIPAPDFVTGGIIINKDDMKKMYQTGAGRIKIRAKIEKEKATAGRTNLVITEIPYTYTNNAEKLVEEIATLAKDGKMPELYDLKNQSSMEGIRIVLEIKKGINIDNFLLKLYKKTGVESNFNAEFRAIVGDSPKQVNIKEFIVNFIDFQEEIYTRKFKYLLKKDKERSEVVKGLIKAHDLIDIIIAAIRGSKDKNQARRCLMQGEVEGIKFRIKSDAKEANKFCFTEKQANAILSMQLGQLIGLELLKLEKEFEKLTNNITVYTKNLTSKNALRSVIRKDLKSLQRNRRKNRVTELMQLGEENYKEEKIIEKVHILIDKYGYLKMVDEASYKRASEDTLKEMKYVISTFNNDKLAIYTNDGKQSLLKLESLSKSKMSERGTPISVLIDAREVEILAVESFENIKEKSLIFVTKEGEAKMVQAIQYETNRKKIATINMNDNDELIYVEVVASDIECLGVYTNKKSGIKIKIGEIPIKNKSNKGTLCVKLKKGEEVIVAKTFGNKPHFLEAKGKKIDFNNINMGKRNRNTRKI